MNFKSTKLLVGIICLIVGTVVECITPNGLSATFAAFLGSVLALYVGGNVAATKAHAKADASLSEGSNMVEPIRQEVEHLREVLSQAIAEDQASGMKNLIEQTNQGVLSLIEAQTNTQKLLRLTISQKKAE